MATKVRSCGLTTSIVSSITSPTFSLQRARRASGASCGGGALEIFASEREMAKPLRKACAFAAGSRRLKALVDERDHRLGTELTIAIALVSSLVTRNRRVGVQRDVLPDLDGDRLWPARRQAAARARTNAEVALVEPSRRLRRAHQPVAQDGKARIVGRASATARVISGELRASEGRMRGLPPSACPPYHGWPLRRDDARATMVSSNCATVRLSTFGARDGRRPFPATEISV